MSNKILGPVAAAIIAGSAQAEAPKAPELVITTSTQAADVCGDGGQKWSATKGFVGCTGAQTPGNPEVIKKDPAPEKILGEYTKDAKPKINVSPMGVGVSLGNNASIGMSHSNKYGSGLNVTLQGGGDTLQFGLTTTLSAKEKQALVAAGFQISDGMVFSVGGAVAEQDAQTALGTSYTPETKNLSASQAFVKLDFSAWGPVAKSAIGYIQGRAKDATLKNVTEYSMDVRTEDLPALIQTWNDYFSQTTATTFHGQKWQTVFGDATFYIGDSGAITLRLGATRLDTIDGSRTEALGGIGYEHYMGKSKVALYANSNAGVSTVGLGYERKFGENVSGFVSVEQVNGVKNDTRVMAGVRITEKTPDYVRPTANKVRVGEVVRSELQDANLKITDIGSRGDIRDHVAPKVKTGEKLIDEAPKAPVGVSNLVAKVGADGNVTLTFDAPGQIPGVIYTCTVNGKNSQTCASGMVFSASFFTTGNNTIEIVAVNNVVAGKPAMSKQVVASVTVFANAPADTLAPEVISVSYNGITVRYRITDKDGVNAKQCVLKQGSTMIATATPDASGLCTFPASPNTNYEVHTLGKPVEVLPNGTQAPNPSQVDTFVPVTTPDVPNTAPIARPDSATTTVNIPVAINVLANDTDADGNPLTVGTFTQGAHGTVTRNGSGLLYTPTAGYTGTDTFTYYAYDGRDNSLTPATVTVTVNGVVDVTPPALTSSSSLGSANIGTTVSDTLTFDEAIGSVSVGAVPAGMTVTPTKSGNTITLQISTTAAFTAFGSVTIPVIVADGVPNSGIVNVTKTINDVAPVAGGAFAVLADMTTDDNGGLPITPIDAGGVTDTLGRTVTYSATGLPPGITINSTSGIISGGYDSLFGETLTIVITAQGSSGLSISKTFNLTINNNG